MSSPTIRLFDSKLEVDGLHAYVFIAEKFSSLGSEMYSKPFHFAGHRWKIQAGIKEKHFGAFLRWLGSGELTKGVKCKVSFTLGVQNKKEIARSIRRGNLADKADEFTKPGCGIGWGKLVSMEELLSDKNFVSDDSVLIELQCCLVETTFENKLPNALNPGDKFLKSTMFSLCKSRWSIMMFPQGPPSKNGVPPQNDHVAVYLHCEDVGLLRYKVAFSFHARSKLAKQREITYNFFDTCHDTCNVFGIEKFMPSQELKRIAKNGKVKIKVRIKFIQPYFYLALNPGNLRNTEGDTCTRGDLVDQCNNSLSLTFGASPDEKVVFKLKYDPEGANEELDDMPYFKKIFWKVVLNSFEDDSETVVVSSSEEAGKSSFCYSEAENSITSSLWIRKIEERGSVFLDEDDFLSVHLFIEDANLIYDPLLDPLTKQSVSKLREEKEQRLRNLERQCVSYIENTMAEKDEIISEQEVLLEKRDSIIFIQEGHIAGLKTEMEENDKYLSELVDGKGEDEASKLLQRSLRQLIKSVKPTRDDIKAQKTVEKKLSKFLKKRLPFNISRVSAVAAYGQNTTLKGVRECDLAIAIQDLPRTEHDSWLPTIVGTIKTLLKQRDKSETSLPPCSEFSTTLSTVNFKCADVDVVLMPINDWENNGGFQALYQMTMKQSADVQVHYNNNVCELQSTFIAKQSDKCKDLIRVVKKWRRDTKWSPGSKPSDYLLSLLVVQAYEVVQPEGCEQSSVDLEVLREMAELVNDSNLELSWDTDNYISAQYPQQFFPKPFSSPVVQDPAIPTHNVAKTDMEDWGELRKKFKEWVFSLSA